MSLDALDLVCFSHLRWHFVFQRPQHLLTRFANKQRVFYVEEPVAHEQAPCLEVTQEGHRLWRVLPKLQAPGSPVENNAVLRTLIDELFESYSVKDYVLWYYSPMMLEFSYHLRPKLTVYDCMDELSAFRGAPPSMVKNEAELLKRADVVFTGGHSLFEAKRLLHPEVHPFPSSIEYQHFARARTFNREPTDQANIPAPRLGFFGVIDERMDLDLLAAVADEHPEWHLVMVGPVVKIDPNTLPQRENIHYLGMKTYQELPDYLAGWDVALLPFAQNESTRFISPTKTPEYLAGGKPVVSTPIQDVVQPYGERGLVWIGGTPAEFIRAIESALLMGDKKSVWLKQVDKFLALSSWDDTWSRMRNIMQTGLHNVGKPKLPKVTHPEPQEILKRRAKPSTRPSFQAVPIRRSQLD